MPQVYELANFITKTVCYSATDILALKTLNERVLWAFKTENLDTIKFDQLIVNI